MHPEQKPILVNCLPEAVCPQVQTSCPHPDVGQDCSNHGFFKWNWSGSCQGTYQQGIFIFPNLRFPCLLPNVRFSGLACYNCRPKLFQGRNCREDRGPACRIIHGYASGSRVFEQCSSVRRSNRFAAASNQCSGVQRCCLVST